MFARSTLLAFAALPLAVYASASSACSKTYTVQAGDYCDLISAKQGVSTYQLIALNTADVLNDCEQLQPGETLCLATSSADDCTDTAVVQQGDTCNTIMAAHGISNTTILMMNNPQVGDACDIYIGEVLCVATTVAAPPYSASAVSSIAASSAPTATPSASSATSAPTVTPSSATSASAPSSSDDGSDGDDGDLPWCDEL